MSNDFFDVTWPVALIWEYSNHGSLNRPLCQASAQITE